MTLASPRRGARPLVVACAALLAVTAFVGAARPAHADSAAAADARAKKLLAKVAAIQKQVDRALGTYNNALGGLAGAVGDNIAADTALNMANAAAQQAQDQATARVRALYRTGGTFGLYASVLSGTDPSDLLSRLQVVQRIVSADKQVLGAGERTLRRATIQAVAARQRANTRAEAAARVDAVAQRLEGLLAQEQALLAQARATAANLRAAEQALAAARASYGAITAERIRTIQPISMPPEYNALYHAAAATCPGLSWTVLAAIGQVESGHGRNTGTSSAGAEGPMQFLPATFASYAVDGNHDGVLDIQNPADAIYSAAHYLCANGAGLGGAHLYSAIWHYNHADWYVQLVLALASRY